MKLKKILLACLLIIGFTTVNYAAHDVQILSVIIRMEKLHLKQLKVPLKRQVFLLTIIEI